MNILFADQFSDPGGAQLCLMALLPEIRSLGWNAHLMAPGEGSLVRCAADFGFTTSLLPLRGYTNGRKTIRDLFQYSFDLPRMRAALRNAVRLHQIDVVYVNGPRVLPAAAGLSCPVIFHAHNVVGRPASGLLMRAVRNSGARVIAASHFVARDYTAAEVIYNGADDLFIRAQGGGAHSVRGAPLRVGILGRIAPEKGHLDFVRAARKVSGATFHVFGDSLFSRPGYEAEVRALAANAPIEFCGWTSDAGAALRSLDILAVPSGRQEAATRVIMEAFSAGTPVVAYRSGGIPELVDHQRTGLLTKPQPEALADALQGLIDAPDLRKSLTAAGREEWRTRFTVQRFQRAVCAVVEQVAAGSPATRADRCTTFASK